MREAVAGHEEHLGRHAAASAAAAAATVVIFLRLGETRQVKVGAVDEPPVAAALLRQPVQ